MYNLRDDRVDDVAGDDEALQLIVARPEEELELLEGQRAHLHAVVVHRVDQEPQEVAQLGLVRREAAG